MKHRFLDGLVAVVLLSLFALAAPSYPEDWDGVGFVLSIARFDMSRFAPHPPGYPVYVAALKFAALFGSDLGAASAVSVVSGAASILFLRDAAARFWGAREGWLVAGGVLLAPLFWRSATVIGSEAMALAFVSLAAWALSHRRTQSPEGRPGLEAVAGLAVGLGIGARLSWAPFFVSLLFLVSRESRPRALLFAVLAALAWLLPLALVVGLSPLVDLCRVHFGGHAARWGGTLLTDAGSRRAWWMLRDLFVDGLGIDGDALGIGIAVALVVLVARAFLIWKKASFAGWRIAAIVCLPYFVWIAIGQNLREQPRHVLPLVAVLVGAMGLAATRDRLALYACATFFSLMGARTLLDAYDRRTIPPAGAHLALYVNANAEAPTLLFGARSARFFAVMNGPARSATAATLGDVSLALGRENILPRRVFVTSELEGLATSPYPLVERARFCRPARLDRRESCVTLFELKAPFLEN